MMGRPRAWAVVEQVLGAAAIGSRAACASRKSASRRRVSSGSSGSTTTWSEAKGLSDQTSVLPTLELLQRMGKVPKFVHRHVVGETEFDNYLSWRESDRRVRTYGTVFFAFHGTRRGL